MPRKTIQYTIRGVPPEVDHALRRMSKQRGVSLNQLLLERLQDATGVEPRKKERSLASIAGKWQEDPEFDRILEEQRQIDWEMWR